MGGNKIGKLNSPYASVLYLPQGHQQQQQHKTYNNSGGGNDSHPRYAINRTMH